MHLNIGVAAAIPGFMLLALIASWQSGFWAAVLVTTVSGVCLDYFFIEPKFSLSIDSYQELLALSSFAAVSVLISHMVQRIRSASQRLEAKEQEQRELFQLSQNILISDWKGGPEEQLCRTLREQLLLRGVSLWDERSCRFWYAGDAADTEEGLRASFRAQTNYDLLAREEHIRVLRFGTRPIGALMFRGTRARPIFLDAVCALVASSLERLRAMRAEVVAESVVLSEQLRTAVLDGLAHSVKTPLTTIAISASGLLELGELTPMQRQFANTIEEQALSISELTTKLLRTAKLDSHEMTVRKRPVNLRELLEAAVTELPEELRSNRLAMKFTVRDLTVHIDPEIMRMALVQLLENGLKYSPPGSAVCMAVRCDVGEVHLRVHNTGSFIPLAERSLVFERYYRGKATEHTATGTGLGLSIAKRAVEMHHGRLEVESSHDGGTTFQISLPIGEPC